MTQSSNLKRKVVEQERNKKEATEIIRVSEMLFSV